MDNLARDVNALFELVEQEDADTRPASFSLNDQEYRLRPLGGEEKEGLVHRGCSLDRAEVLLGLPLSRPGNGSAPGGSANRELASVCGVTFRGTVVLLLDGPAGARGRLVRCAVDRCVVSLGACVEDNCEMSHVVVEQGATVRRNHTIACSAALSAVRRVQVGPEVGTGFLELDLHARCERYESALAKLVSGGSEVGADGPGEEYRMSFVGGGALVECNDRLDAVVVATDAKARAPPAAHVSSSRVSQVYMASGCRIENAMVDACALAPEASVRLGAQASGSYFFGGAGVSSGARVASSVLGPRAHAEAIEVTSSFVGPNVGMHHQGLLIAALWPEGRGNMGCGALCGSNHTGRTADTMLWQGEGVFVGLNALLKYPCTFLEAPYTIIAAGAVVPPMRLKLPFSLLSGGADGRPPRCAPAWVLRKSYYTVARNDMKFRKRAAPGMPEPAVLRAATVRFCLAARDRLRSFLAGRGEERRDAVVRADDLPLLGAAWAYEGDLRDAVAAYSDAVRLFALRWLHGALERSALGRGGGEAGGAFDAHLEAVCDPSMLPGPALASRGGPGGAGEGPDAAEGWSAWLAGVELGLALPDRGQSFVLPGSEAWPGLLDALKALPPLERAFAARAAQSKGRDDVRGRRITPLYDKCVVAASSDRDAVLAEAEAVPRRVEESIEDIARAIAGRVEGSPATVE